MNHWSKACAIFYENRPLTLEHIMYDIFSIIMAMEQNFEAISEKLMCTKSVVK
jgi:hypothetical protein